MLMSFRYFFFLVLCLLILDSGCAPKRVSTLSVPSTNSVSSAHYITGQGVRDLPYHIVSEGETLWRICKNYGVSMIDVVRLNNISDPSNIEVGQKIYLPITPSSKSPTLRVAGRYSGPTEKTFSWPVKGQVVLFYGQCKDGWVNKGIEIRGSDSKVVSPKTGKVVFIGNELRGYGLTIMIDHGDGFISVIAGMGQKTVNLGDVVKKGQVIMKIAPYTIIHYELRKNAQSVNPLRYLN